MYTMSGNVVMQGNSIMKRGRIPTKTVASASGSNVIASTVAQSGIASDLMLTDIVPLGNDASLRKFYRDIYEYDAIGGSYVDLVSTLPFSDYNLYGGTSEELQIHEDALSRLNIKQLMPEVTMAHLVDGAFLGSLVYDKQKKNFMDIIPYNLNNVQFTDVPFYSLDPIINVNNDDRVRNFLNSNSSSVQAYKDAMPKDLLEAMRATSYELDPLITLFVPRRVDIHSSLGVSVYKRLLPIYLLEKILYRGTIVEASKRQRALLHAQAGDENWDPTPEELNEVVGIFQQAEMDPLGAIVATRKGIDVQEVRQGGDFWKYTDVYGDTSTIKLRALGISESFLSGEASYNSAEINMTVFIESLKHIRNNGEHRIFTSKVFPMISSLHGLKKSKKETNDLDEVRVNDLADTFIPRIHWTKNLEPQDNKDMMDVLEKLTEKGLPVPIRMMLTAGGVNPASYLRELEEDISYQQRISTAKKKLEELDLTGDGIADAVASFIGKSNIKGLASRLPALNEEFEIIGQTRTGKPKVIHNQVKAQKQCNEVIAKAYNNLSKDNKYATIVDRLKKGKK